MIALIYQLTNSRTHSLTHSVCYPGGIKACGRGGRPNYQHFLHIWTENLQHQAPDRHNVMKRYLLWYRYWGLVSVKAAWIWSVACLISEQCVPLCPLSLTHARRFCLYENRPEQGRTACYVSHIHGVSGKRVVPFKRNPTFMCASSARLLHSCMHRR